MANYVTMKLRESWSAMYMGIRRHGKMIPVATALCALLVGLLLAICGFGVPEVPEMDAASELCLKEKRYSEAAIWARRSLLEQPEATRSRMNLIRSQIAMGAWEPLAEHLNKIAPMDKAVHGPAHLLRAQLIWASQPGETTARKAAVRCLNLAWEAGLSASSDQASRIAAHVLGAQLAASEGNWRKVLAEVAEIPHPDCDIQAIKAFAYWNLDLDDEASKAADEAIENAERLEEAVDGSLRSRKLSVSVLACLSKGKPASAIEAISSARLDRSHARERLLLKELSKSIAGACRSQRQKDPKLWMEAMATALEAIPEDYELTMMLVEGVTDWKTMPGFIEWMNDRFSSGELRGLRDLIAGMDALTKSMSDTATARFEEAHALLPNNPVIGNNHAALLGTRPVSPDTGKARAIMADIVKLHPAQPAFLDTMGRIELRCGNNREAIAWFEAALKLQSNAGTHLAVAEAYARMGNAVMAKEHRMAAGVTD